MKRRRGALEGKDTYSNNIYADLRVTSLMDLYKRSKIELEEIKGWNEMPKDLSQEDLNLTKSQLEGRKAEIERICDAHLKELLRVTRQDAGAFMGMDYKKKFLVLSANEGILQKSYRRHNK